MINLLFNDSYFQKILLGIVILAFTTGAIGVFVTERKQALVGDALSHAALPGVVIAFMIFNTRRIEVLLLGALIASLISMFLLEIIKRYSKIKFDASMALILSAFFGFGNVLMNFLIGSDQAGLQKFIFGEAATMLQKDVNMIVIVSVVVLFLAILFWKHIKLYIFDEGFYSSLGFNSKLISGLLSFLTVLVVIISIRAIGVVLMSALLIAPAVTARFWSDRLNVNFILAGIFGAIAGIIGTYFSFTVKGLPTGPVIVVALSIILIVSLLLSPKKGLIVKAINIKRHKYLIVKYHDLVHLYQHNEFSTNNIEHLNHYLNKGYITNDNSKYQLTNKGNTLVNNILRGEKLWV